MAKHFAAKKNDDLEMLLGDSQMPWTRTEGGCHKSTLIKALFFTSVLLVLVTVSWFLHYNVFLEKDSKPVVTVDGNSEGCPPQGSASPPSFIDIDSIVEFAQTVDMKAIAIPPELMARVGMHIPEMMKYDFSQVMKDKPLLQSLKTFLTEVHQNFTDKLLATTTTTMKPVPTTTEANGDDMKGMDHGDMDDGDMDHGNMGDMDHGNMGDMDHGNMGDMDHGNMDHGNMEGMHHDSDGEDEETKSFIERRHRVDKV